MYLPGTMLMWMVFILGLISTVTYALAIKDPSRWRAMPRPKSYPDAYAPIGYRNLPSDTSQML